MSATLLKITNPFDTIKKENISNVKIGQPINQYFSEDMKAYPYVCLYNGQAILRKDWNIKIKDNDNIVFMNMLYGGGGRRQKNLTNIVVGLGAVALSIVLKNPGLAIQGAYGIFSGLLGTKIVNTDSHPINEQTNSTILKTNLARINQPIPVSYGEYRLYPDLAGQPYTYLHKNGNDYAEFTHYLYCLGQGAYRIDQNSLGGICKIGDTKIKDIYPHATTDIDSESLGQTCTKINLVSHDLKAFIIHNDKTNFDYSKDNNTTCHLYDYRICTLNEFSGKRLIGQDGSNENWLGWYNFDSNNKSNLCEINLIFPQGLYFYNNKGSGSDKFEENVVTIKYEVSYVIDGASNTYRHQTTIRDNKTDIFRTKIIIDLKSIVGDSTNAYLEKIRIRKTDLKDDDSDKIEEVNVLSVIYYDKQEQYDFGNVTMLAIAIKNNEKLGIPDGQSINLIAQRDIPVYRENENGDFVKEIVSDNSISINNLSSIMYDMLLLDYGANYKETKINHRSLKKIQCQINKHYKKNPACLFVSKTTVWEALNRILFSFRAYAVFKYGVIHFVSDFKEERYNSLLFNNNNIVKDSFTIEYKLHNTEDPDHVDLTFIDSETWRPKKIFQDISGNNRKNPLSVDLFGCTDETQAILQAQYIANSNKYRKKNITFDTELEGYICNIGDTVFVNHSVFNITQTGQIVNVLEDKNILTMNVPLNFRGNQYMYLEFIKSNNRFLKGETETSGQNMVFKCKEVEGDIYSCEIEKAIAYHNRLDFNDTYNYDNQYDVEFVRSTEDFVRIKVHISQGHIDNVLNIFNSKDPIEFSLSQFSEYARKCIVTSISPKKDNIITIGVVENDERVYPEITSSINYKYKYKSGSDIAPKSEFSQLLIDESTSYIMHTQDERQGILKKYTNEMEKCTSCVLRKGTFYLEKNGIIIFKEDCRIDLSDSNPIYVYIADVDTVTNLIQSESREGVVLTWKAITPYLVPELFTDIAEYTVGLQLFNTKLHGNVEYFSES